MPQDLPGFYYDPEKNRYFPIKGPIPGSSRKPKPTHNSVSLLSHVPNKPKKDVRISKLLQCRELYGRFVDLSDRKGSFQEECKKQLVSKPRIWKYPSVEKDADCSLALMHINVETPEGQCATDALITGGKSGSLSLFDVGYVGQHFNHGHKTAAEFLWPEQDEFASYQTPKDIWKFNGATLILPSSVSSISMPRKEYLGADNNSSVLQRALVTTFGSDISGGALYILNLAAPVDVNSDFVAIGRLREHVSLNCTIWGADTCDSGRKAVVGTNLGATVVDLESGVSSTVCRSKSHVLSVQLIQSGNVALCGLRNGAIVTIDVRQPHRQLPRHRVSLPSPASDDSYRPAQKRIKHEFKLRGNIQPCTVYMPSSICSLASLEMYDQYFLASSMDGSIKLYDHRLTKRGPVQSYEGHVNSHNHIRLATDASERFLMSGGEDCKMRIWSIKSGEMLFEEQLSTCVPMAACWQGNADSIGKKQSSETHSWDAWLGSAEGLLRMQFCL